MTQLTIVEPDESGRRIAQHIHVLMAYAGIRHTKDLAPRIEMTQQTLSRRMLTQGGWMFHEVAAIADYFGCTLDEMQNGLPTLAEWTDRDSRACRDSNPKPSVLESERRYLWLAAVNGELTVNRIPAGWPIPEPRHPEAEPERRHLRAVV